MILPNELRSRAMTVYLAADEGPANDLSQYLGHAADRIEQLEIHLTVANKRLAELENPDFVLVRRDDLEWIVNLTERKSQDAKFSPKLLRLKAALEKTP